MSDDHDLRSRIRLQMVADVFETLRGLIDPFPEMVRDPIGTLLLLRAGHAGDRSRREQDQRHDQA